MCRPTGDSPAAARRPARRPDAGQSPARDGARQYSRTSNSRRRMRTIHSPWGSFLFLRLEPRPDRLSLGSLALVRGAHARELSREHNRALGVRLQLFLDRGLLRRELIALRAEAAPLVEFVEVLLELRISLGFPYHLGP